MERVDLAEVDTQQFGEAASECGVLLVGALIGQRIDGDHARIDAFGGQIRFVVQPFEHHLAHGLALDESVAPGHQAAVGIKQRKFGVALEEPERRLLPAQRLVGQAEVKERLRIVGIARKGQLELFVGPGKVARAHVDDAEVAQGPGIVRRADGLPLQVFDSVCVAGDVFTQAHRGARGHQHTRYDKEPEGTAS